MQRRGLLLGFALAAASAMVFAREPAGPQTQPAGSSSIDLYGRVIDGTTHAPIPDAVVTLGGRAGPPTRVIVDPEGRFVFHNLTGGAATISATHGGYFGSGNGDRDPAAPPRVVQIVPGEQPGALTLTLWKLGAISGTVRADGTPLVGTEVRALRRTLVAGSWRLATVSTTMTDDRGRYRLSGLAPGEYVVTARPESDPETALLVSVLAATPALSADVMAAATASGRGVPDRDASIKTYGTSFFRDATTATLATRLVIDAATDRAGVDFLLRSTRTFRVAGRLTGIDGPAEGLIVRLLPADSSIDGDAIEIAAAACDTDGRFELSNITPGKYVVALLARPPAPPPQPAPPPGSGPPAPPALPTEPTWWARTPLTVTTANVSGLNVPVRKGSIVSGRVEFAGQMPPPATEIAQIGIRLDSANAVAVPGTPPWRGLVSADRSFTTMNVPAGSYFVRVTNVPRGWTVESARVGSRDALDEAIEIADANVNDVIIRFVDRPFGAITGTVQDATGAPLADARILMFPATRTGPLDTSAQARRFKQIRSTPTGTFGLGGLPAGTYFVVASADAPATEWQDAKRLDGLAAQATRVDIGSTPAAPVTLTIVKATVKK